MLSYRSQSHQLCGSWHSSVWTSEQLSRLPGAVHIKSNVLSISGTHFFLLINRLCACFNRLAVRCTTAVEKATFFSGPSLAHVCPTSPGVACSLSASVRRNFTTLCELIFFFFWFPTFCFHMQTTFQSVMMHNAEQSFDLK